MFTPLWCWGDRDTRYREVLLTLAVTDALADCDSRRKTSTCISTYVEDTGRNYVAQIGSRHNDVSSCQRPSCNLGIINSCAYFARQFILLIHTYTVIYIQYYSLGRGGTKFGMTIHYGISPSSAQRLKTPKSLT